ncbi:uncharacterized protein MONOS_2468 [Monocercomonoides exilis]|uniref:uncharacterized protein n=1 Tax=Monocercomonoides exilis TaxID=2049356 RepID=UPI00355A88E4|nr:hypothetical protein MONOS_2468 [Monocercomonoides exilis]|eukprot:MONOS_2468.1-p1 / transcript=MONOS_2468.1 / gene=MONOS_2468 / organism=Monocercomonoides_exilis_PA203 / gene_product=unspecified product / transcript_product=unspecified product / location=Mono_scaffold00051:84977-86990(-) / protein_length=323 / sequence_SO=supercontig / SO=protein_coding / is_pseudo=false
MDNPAWFGQLKRRIILRNDVQYQSLRTKGSYTLKRNIAHLFDAYGKIVDLSSKLHSSEKKLHELNEEITNNSKVLEAFRCLAFTADGRFFAVGVKGGAISIYNTSTAKLYSTLVSESADISSIVFTTPTGDLPPTLVTASSNGKLSVWDVAGGKEQIILDSQSECCGICASANATVCSAHKDGYIRVCDIRSKELIKELSAGSEGAAVTCMSVSEDGQLLLAVFSDGTVAVFDLSSFSEIRYWSIADLRPSHTFGSCCWIESSFFIGCQNGMIATGTLNDEQIKSVYLSELGDSSPVIHCAASSRKNKLVAATPDQISFWIVE